MNDWWTAPAEAPDGQIVMVTGRRDIAKYRNNPRFSIRVTVAWRYAPAGMPSDADAETMGVATDGFTEVLAKDPVAVLSTNIFNKKLNEALAPLPLLPLEISAENDPRWEEYDEMCECEITTTDD